jgi:hypothetical protein
MAGFGESATPPKPQRTVRARTRGAHLPGLMAGLRSGVSPRLTPRASCRFGGGRPSLVRGGLIRGARPSRPTRPGSSSARSRATACSPRTAACSPTARPTARG